MECKRARSLHSLFGATRIGMFTLSAPRTPLHPYAPSSWFYRFTFSQQTFVSSLPHPVRPKIRHQRSPFHSCSWDHMSSAKLVITANSALDSGDRGALPGRSTTTVWTPALVDATASARLLVERWGFCMANMIKYGIL